MNALRVCHLGKHYPPAAGGIETHVRVLSRAQADLGHTVEVLCLNHERGPTVHERDGDVAVTRFAPAASFAKIAFSPALVAALARIEADVVHVHAPNPTMLLALLQARPRAAVVATYHSDVVRQKLRGALFRPLERLAYRRVQAIVSDSPNYAAGSTFLRAYADRIHVVPIGIDLQPYLDPSPAHLAEAAQIRERFARRGPVWLAVGRLVYYKGFVHAIRALTRVPGTLLLVGRGPDEPELRAEALKVGVADRVEFIGALPHYLDITPYYYAADALWFPSNARSESFGLVQVEAMACGLPVINTHIPHSGVSWVSPHEQTGLTVPMNDPLAIADAAARLLHEPGLRARLAEAARRRAVDRFDHSLMAERSLEIYQAVLRRAAATRKSIHAHVN
ncbi:MAG: glycosyltransferase [Planctomycetota bacterium]|nr:glycosyltransferase [Planctomycetota bacterium]